MPGKGEGIAVLYFPLHHMLATQWGSSYNHIQPLWLGRAPRSPGVLYCCSGEDSTLEDAGQNAPS